MANTAQELSPLRDIEDFLDWVHGQEGRYEFVDGRIVAMAAATCAHNDLQIRLIVTLARQLERTPCRVNGSDLLIRTAPASSRRGRFADASIECDPPTHRRLSDHPAVVFEILSPDTELTDRTVKLREYQAMPSLQHYVLVAQDAPRVEVYSRKDGDAWLYRKLEGDIAVLRLESPGVALPLVELYGGILDEPAGSSLR